MCICLYCQVLIKCQREYSRARATGKRVIVGLILLPFAISSRSGFNPNISTYSCPIDWEVRSLTPKPEPREIAQRLQQNSRACLPTRTCWYWIDKLTTINLWQPKTAVATCNSLFSVYVLLIFHQILPFWNSLILWHHILLDFPFFKALLFLFCFVFLFHLLNI